VAARSLMLETLFAKVSAMVFAQSTGDVITAGVHPRSLSQSSRVGKGFCLSPPLGRPDEPAHFTDELAKMRAVVSCRLY